MDYDRAGSVFKALGHPTRLRILGMLRGTSACVQRLEMDLGLKQPNISQHLRILKDLGLVDKTRDGQTSCYSINEALVEPLLAHIELRCPSTEKKA
ncbi:MAG: winged helix-turn-helix transcriptional regulator [bacterium]|nr:winged helix-turn-helix transcriptional regulator [bacterium]